MRENRLQVECSIAAVNKSPSIVVNKSQASITGDEGKQVTGSVQYCAVNKSHCAKVSITGDEGKQVMRENRLQVQCSIVL